MEGLTLKVCEPLIATLGLGGSLDPGTLSRILVLLLPALFLFNHLISTMAAGGPCVDDPHAVTPQKSRKPGVVTSSGKGGVPADCLCIVGASGSGKTALLYHLATGEMRETVSSIHENGTAAAGSGPIEVKMPSSGSDDDNSVVCRLNCLDIPGHFNFKERIQEVLESARAVILVIDSKDR